MKIIQRTGSRASLSVYASHNNHIQMIDNLIPPNCDILSLIRSEDLEKKTFRKCESQVVREESEEEMSKNEKIRIR